MEATSTHSGSETGDASCDESTFHCYVRVDISDLGTHIREALAFDFEQDGTEEIVVLHDIADPETTTVSSALQILAGGYSTRATFAPIQYDRKSGTSRGHYDFDGDGRVDLATTTWLAGTGYVYVMLSDGIGLLPAVEYTFPELLDGGDGLGPGNPALVDVDGDGVPEALVVDPDDGLAYLHTLENGEYLRTESGIVLPNAGCSTFGFSAVADLDNDGDEDLAVLDGASWCDDGPGAYDERWHWVAVLLSASEPGLPTLAGQFGTGVPSDAGLWLADFDGDERIDIGMRPNVDPGISVILGGGVGEFDSATARCVDTEVPQAVGDFDGDGEAEWLSISGGNFVATSLDCSSRLVQPGVAEGAVLSLLGTGDFNGDGLTDIVGQAIDPSESTFVLLSGAAN